MKFLLSLIFNLVISDNDETYLHIKFKINIRCKLDSWLFSV